MCPDVQLSNLAKRQADEANRCCQKLQILPLLLRGNTALGGTQTRPDEAQPLDPAGLTAGVTAYVTRRCGSARSVGQARTVGRIEGEPAGVVGA